MNEIEKVIGGLILLRNNGATGTIAHTDQIVVVGAKEEISQLDLKFLAVYGFKRIEGNKWAISV